MKKVTTISFAALFVLCTCNNARPGDYARFTVDNGMKSEIEKHQTVEGLVSMGEIKVKMFENDSLIFDGYNEKTKFPLFTIADLRNDTIHIIGFCGMTAAFGFYIDMYKDNAEITTLIKTDAEIYKLNKEDSLQFGLSVPCTAKKLVVTDKPTYKKGDVIEGEIELTSKDFYEVANGKEKKTRLQLTAWFKTEPLK
jgi:hypothetical protein